MLRVLIYLGFGFAFQYLFYGNAPMVEISTWAHILLWPLFFLWIVLGWMMHLAVLAVLLGLVVAAYFVWRHLDKIGRWRLRRQMRRQSR